MPEDKLQAPRILIVEDEPMLALTLEELLVNAGFAIAGVFRQLFGREKQDSSDNS